MLLLNSKISIFFSPDSPIGSASGTTSGIGGSGPMGHEEMIDFLASDDNPDDKEVLDLGKDKTPPKDTKTTDDKTDDKEDETESERSESEEPDELAELEQELEPPTDEQLELVTPVRRKEILAKYPTLFKDFPYLERAYYREQAFTEIFPTIPEAQEAVEKAQTLDRFENEILSGSTENLLRAVKEENPRGFHKLVDNYMATLASVDEQAYYHILSNQTKHLIVAMVKEARSSKNEVLQNAAQILNQFAFGSSDFTPPTNLVKEGEKDDDKKDNKIDERQQQFIQTQFNTVKTDLDTKVNNILKNTIDANIDPKKSMSDYVRKNASREALETLADLISKDTRFKTIVDKLWEAAWKDNFSKSSMDKIRGAFSSKARTLLPSVIKKARNEALRGTGRKVSDGDEEEQTSNRGPITAGRPRSQTTSGKIKDPKDIPKKMSTLEFLNSD